MGVGDMFQGADEAGCVAGGEELFGVGAGAAAAHAFGWIELGFEFAIIGSDDAIAAANGFGVGGIHDFFERHWGFSLVAIVVVILVG